jgi:hypothetical protein
MLKEKQSLIANIKIFNPTQILTNIQILRNKLSQKPGIITSIHPNHNIFNLIDIPLIKIINFFNLIFLIQ